MISDPPSEKLTGWARMLWGLPCRPARSRHSMLVQGSSCVGGDPAPHFLGYKQLIICVYFGHDFGVLPHLHTRPSPGCDCDEGCPGGCPPGSHSRCPSCCPPVPGGTPAEQCITVLSKLFRTCRCKVPGVRAGRHLASVVATHGAALGFPCRAPSAMLSRQSRLRPLMCQGSRFRGKGVMQSWASGLKLSSCSRS